MLYFLLCLVGLAALLSAVNVLPYNWIDIVVASVVTSATCWSVTWTFGKLTKAKINPESSFITGLILTLIMGPLPFASNLPILVFLGAAAALSKFLFVWNKGHLFNPAATAAIATALLFDVSASWWVGSIYLLPLVLVGGIYETFYKINRTWLVVSFVGVYVLLSLIQGLWNGTDLIVAGQNVWNTLLYSPILFFALVMLVEPLTSPADHARRVVFGILVATLAVILPYLLRVPYTLELSLLIGNVFATFSGNQGRLLLTLQKKENLAPNVVGFWFKPKPKRTFESGQFLHYTLPHRGSDARGSRRYFSIASSPNESNILLVTKFADPSSSFKHALRSMAPGDELSASRPEGTFVLPRDPSVPLVFIAGGIGITPFRSMLQHLLDTGQQRPITLLYAARTEQDLLFRPLLKQAQQDLQTNIVYVLDQHTDKPGFEQGPLTPEIISKHTSGRKTLFYISGPEPMVRGIIDQLHKIDVPHRNIRRDYFPGYNQ